MAPEARVNALPRWTLWHHTGKFTGARNWGNGLRSMDSFDTFDEFSRICGHVRNLERGQGFFVFKQGIRPEWEHKENNNGGRWETCFPGKEGPDNVDQHWKRLVRALVEGKLSSSTDEKDDDDEWMVCGVAVWPRKQIDVWTRYSSLDHNEKNLAIGAQMAKALSVNRKILYYAHADFEGKSPAEAKDVALRLIYPPGQ